MLLLSFYEISGLAICKNIKAFNWFNRKQLKILKAFSEYIPILLLTEDDSALNVAWQLTLQGLVAYKPVAYEKV